MSIGGSLTFSRMTWFCCRIFTGPYKEIPREGEDSQLGQAGGNEASGTHDEDIQAEVPGDKEAPRVHGHLPVKLLGKLPSAQTQ